MSKPYRFEMRLDDEYVKKLREIAAEYGTTPTEAVRKAIDEAYWKAGAARRREALRRIIEMDGIEEMPEPDELTRQLEHRYDDDLP